MNSLELFDQKVETLLNWCEDYKQRLGKWPTTREVFAAQLDGFKSMSEVSRMMKYLADDGHR